MAAMGHHTTTVDLRRYPYRHGNLRSIEKDFLEVPMDEKSFDCVYAISAIEHVGLERYGRGHPKMKIPENGDVKVAGKICHILKPGGRFTFTVPFGIRGRAESYRVMIERRSES